MALSTIPEPTGQAEQAATVQPEQPRGLTVRERFNALTPQQRDEILDKHRDWNVEHVDWWDGVYDCFKHDMEAIGIEVAEMYFSGFWSQGDGACFVGRVSDWTKFLTSVGITDAALTRQAEAFFTMSVEHSGHYYHENCTRFSVDFPLPENDEDEHFIAHYLDHLEGTELHHAVMMANLAGYSSNDLEETFTEAFKDHMRKLYAQLEEEHNHLTSDEAVLDSLDANDALEDAINSIIEEANDA